MHCCERGARRRSRRCAPMARAIAIDDFGTGYSNLARLRELPIDRIKLDRSLIEHIADQHEARDDRACRDRAGPRAGLRSGGRGDRARRAQADVLRVIGCDVLQGYAIAAPMAEAAFLAWVAAREPRPADRLIGRLGEHAPRDDVRRRSRSAVSQVVARATASSRLCIVALTSPNSTTGHSLDRKRASEVPPVVDSSGTHAGRRLDRVGDQRRRARPARSGTPRPRRWPCTVAAGAWRGRSRSIRSTSAAPRVHVVEADAEPRARRAPG